MPKSRQVPLTTLLLCLPCLLSISLLAPGLLAQNGSTTYPGSPDTNANLGVAVDRFTARMSGHVSPTDTTWTLRNLSKALVNNMFLSAGDEIVMVTAIPRSDQVTVTRHVCGTTAADHYDGETVGAVWNSCMHNGLRSAIQALEAGGGGGGAVSSVFTRTGAVVAQTGDYTASQVGAIASTALDTDGTMAANSSSRVPSQSAVVTYVASHGGGGGGGGGSTPFLLTSDYNFASQTPGGAISPGANTITLTPVPKGVNGTDSGHLLYISGGTGTAESCTIGGGTATSGSGSGTVVLTCANSHSGAWTVSSATLGIQEALQYGGANAWVAIPPGTFSLHAPISFTAVHQTLQGSGMLSTTLVADNGLNYSYLVLAGYNYATFSDFTIDGNFINQTGGAGNMIALQPNTLGHKVLRMGLIHAGAGGPTGSSTSFGVLVNGAQDVEVGYCLFASNWGYDLGFNTVDSTGRTLHNYFIHDNQFGTPNISASNSNVNYWDTYSAGQYSLIANGYSDMTVTRNRFYGAVKKPFLGNPIAIANAINIVISNNLIDGLGNGAGTLSVTNGSGAVTGTNTFFNTGGVPGNDNRAWIQVEGDPTMYQITAVASSTSITVTPVMSRTTASGLRYKISSTGDGLGCGGCTNASITGNVVINSHDNGIDAGADLLFGTLTKGSHYTVTGNVMVNNYDAGLWIGGITGLVATGNTIMNNGQVGSGAAASARPGIWIQNDTADMAISRVIISGNIIADDQASATQQYGLSLFGTAGGNLNTFGTNLYSGNALGSYYATPSNAINVAFVFSDWADVSTLPFTVSLLPTCSSGLEGKIYPVTDANSTTFNAAVVGGSTNHMRAYCNGTSWVIR